MHSVPEAAGAALKPGSLLFGTLRIDPAAGELVGPGGREQLDPKVMQVLLQFLDRRDEIITRDELLAAVWPGAIVTNDVLSRCIYQLRVHLQRAGGDERYKSLLETLPKRGYRLNRELAAEGALPARGRWPRRSIAVVIGLIVTAFGLWWATSSRDTREPAPAPPAPSIAVLAFADMSEGRDHEYFADGISEEILNLLTRIPGLSVVARTSSFSFKGKDADIATIGKALDVGYVLEGSVRRSGDQVRVTTQLVDTTTSTHIWSETYDRAIDDLLTVQTEIAASVARSLKITLAESSGISAGRAVNPDAYGHFLHARFLHNRRSPGDLATAEAHFRRALEIDPDFAPAWAGLAGTLLVRIFEDDLDSTVGLEWMGEAVTRALTLDPSLPEAQMRASHYHFHFGNLEQALQHWHKAKALDPDNALVLGGSATVAIARGDYEQGLELQLRAAELDPLNPTVRGNLSHFLARVGRYEEAARELQRTKELNPARADLAIAEGQLLILRGRFGEALAVVSQWPEGPDREQALALIYRALGRADEANAEMQKLLGRNDQQRARRLAEIHAQHDEIDEAFAWVAVAQEAERAATLTPGSAIRALEFAISPFLRPLHDDPRWQRYLWKVE
ncbi:MAG: tetratricopeptide repeat protein [Steroidobacteraceae bacterium]